MRVSLQPPRTSASIPQSEKPVVVPSGNPSLAVLPFANISGHPEQEYFSDGIADKLTSRLSRLPR
jgi:adenylate cyclase